MGRNAHPRHDDVDEDDDVIQQLRVLGADSSTSCFWSTHDDRRMRRDLDFAANAPFAEVRPRLRQLNTEGAGVFVCLGRVDGSERLSRNVRAIDVLVLDLDGPLLPSKFAPMPPPHLVVATSPGRWHVYWMLCGMPIDAFEIMQRKLAIRFDGDRSVSCREQLIRVPGFVHHKKQPFLSHVTASRLDAGRHRFLDLADALRDIDFMSDPLQGPQWIRHHVSGEIVDSRFKHFAVWSEVLKLDSIDPSVIASRAWRVCEARTEVTRARPITSPEELCSIALNVLGAISAGR